MPCEPRSIRALVFGDNYPYLGKGRRAGRAVGSGLSRDTQRGAIAAEAAFTMRPPGSAQGPFAQLVDLVAQPGRLFELQVLGMLVHLRLELLDHDGSLVSA